MNTSFGYHGDLSVLESIVKRKNLDDGKRITVIFGGGGQKVVIQAAIAKALIKHGLIKHVNNLLGVSAGNVIAYRAKEYATRPYNESEADVLVSSFYKQNIENKLIDWYRFGNWIDIDTLGNYIRSIDYKFEDHRSAAPNLYIGYGTKKTDAFHVASAKKLDNPLDLIINSMAVPFLSRRARLADQHDGYFENPIPLQFVHNHLRSTDTLMILSNPISPDLATRHKGKLMLEKTMRSILRPGPLRNFLTAEVIFDEEVEEIYTNDPKRTLVIYPTTIGISNVCMDPNLLSHAANRAFDYMDNLISSLHQPGT